MLAQRRRLWDTIVPALGQRVVFAGIYLTRYTDAMLAQRWPSVAEDGPPLNQHWISVSC